MSGINTIPFNRPATPEPSPEYLTGWVGPIQRKGRYRVQHFHIGPLPDTAWVQLSKGKWTLIDANAVDRVRATGPWSYANGMGSRHLPGDDGLPTTVILHRFIMDTRPKVKTFFRNKKQWDCRACNIYTKD